MPLRLCSKGRTQRRQENISNQCSILGPLTAIGTVLLQRDQVNNMSTIEPLVLAHVIQDVLNPFTPTVPLRITDGNKLLVAGAELKPSAVVSKPRADIGGNDMRAFYTLVLVDPDAPSPSNPSLREYLHWMVADIRETTSASFGQDLMFYERPEPRSGIHRMVFVLFRQLGRWTVFVPELRHNFNCRSFAQQYHLSISAATYFNCQREAGSGGRSRNNTKLRFLRDMQAATCILSQAPNYAFNQTVRHAFRIPIKTLMQPNGNNFSQLNITRYDK
ncbi:hypothetical protein EJB05_42538, partial [Eragrostis curvula]